MYYAGGMNDLDLERVKLKRKGFALLRYDDRPIHSYPYDSPWLVNREFCTLYASIRESTLVDRPRCFHLWHLAQQARKIEGDVLEIGAWRGGTAVLMAHATPSKTVYVADTFEGVVKSREWEHYVDGAHNDASIADVRRLSDSLRIRNMVILPGVFPDQTGKDIASVNLSLVHLDVDVEMSASEAFHFIWGKVSVGGIVVFDDYGFVTACEGVTRFVDSLSGDADKLLLRNLNGQAVVVKLH